MVAYPVAGALLASRRRSNPIGWFLLGVGMVTAARALAGEYALHALAVPPHPRLAVWAAWFVGWSLTLLFPAPAGAGPGRPAVRPGPLQRRAGGRAVFGSAARRSRSRCAGRRPARRGASRPGPDATGAMAERHRRPIDR